MTIEFRELDKEAPVDWHLDPMSVKFGLLEDGPDDKSASPAIMLVIDGIEVAPFNRDQAVSLILALQEKVRVWDYFYRLAPDHCRDCVDEMIAEGPEPTSLNNLVEVWDENRGGCDD